MILRIDTLTIRPITPAEINAVFAVYQQCEDFLALGPEPTASMTMVQKDFELSQSEGGIFCGIYATDENMIGIVDYIPKNFEGKPSVAFLSFADDCQTVSAPGHRAEGCCRG
jgi:hypothetical protein